MWIQPSQACATPEVGSSFIAVFRETLIYRSF
jgi:hypothetical protein